MSELGALLSKTMETLETQRRAADLPEEKAHYSKELEVLKKVAVENRVPLGA